MSIKWAVTFKDKFKKGTHNTYLKIQDDSGATTNWQDKGDWTISP